MSEITIKIKNIGKRYRIGESNEFMTMRENITRFTSKNVKRLATSLYRRTLGNNSAPSNRSVESPGGGSQAWLDTGAPQANPDAGRLNYIWSLRNVSFDVHRGEIIGIIGRNGAGKSTLLKIITGITEPSEGRIDIYGRIASLLEVGTGFHLELTGRENIYLNGAILGMRKREIDNKFDEIVDFSEVEQFIDTPVKYYSSGMRVRLGFSVAAHLEPEILLIDEVLAVGDASFQKKCLGKLNNVATSEGRTVLFVSHDMAAILSLCQQTVMLESGRLIAQGPTDQIVQRYMQSMSTTYETPLVEREDRDGDLSVKVTSLKIENAHRGDPIRPGSKLRIELGYTSGKQIRYPQIIIKIRDFRTRVNILRFDSEVQTGLPDHLPLTGTIVCETEAAFLTPGRCVVDIEFKKSMVTADRIEYAGHFDVETGDVYGSGKIPSREQSVYLLKYEWRCENKETLNQE